MARKILEPWRAAVEVPVVGKQISSESVYVALGYGLGTAAATSPE